MNRGVNVEAAYQFQLTVKKTKVLFIIPTLGYGGSERILITLCRCFDQTKFDLSLALVSEGGPFRSMVPPWVNVFDLNLGRVRHAAIPLLRLIKRLNPDAILSFLGHLNLLILALRSFISKRTKLIIRESTIVKVNLEASGGWWFAPMYRLLYNRADTIICQSAAMKNDLIHNYGMNPVKTRIVYNPVDIKQIDLDVIDAPNPYPADTTYRNILVVGRLSNEKRLDLLICEFARFRKANLTCRLWILGAGALLDDLQRLSRNLGVSDYVHFMGFQANPYVWMKHADLFVLCSAYEGLPNVLLEALACGCPVVATDCPGGTREIMELTGNTGRLVPVNEFEFREEFFEKINVSKTRRLLEKYFGLATVIKSYESILDH